MPAEAEIPKAFVVEDDAALRDSLLLIFDGDGIPSQGFPSAEAFLEGYGAEWRGCLLTDIRLPGMDGLALTEELARRGSRLAIVVMTGFAELALAVRAMRAGASDFLEKPFDAQCVVAAVRRAMAKPPSASAFSAEVERAMRLLTHLSRREREVFDGLVMGKLGKQVAIDLGISPRTVEIYRANVMTKLGATTLSDLIRLGVVAELAAKGED